MSSSPQATFYKLGCAIFDKLIDRQVRAKIVRGEYDMPEVLFQHVSLEAQDFIANLLVLDPEKRMSAEQALAHSWLRSLRYGSSSLPAHLCQQREHCPDYLSCSAKPDEFITLCSVVDFNLNLCSVAPSGQGHAYRCTSTALAWGFLVENAQ